LAGCTGRISKPLTGLNKALENRTHGGGDLTQRLAVETEDEIGVVAESVNDLIASIEGMVVRIADTTVELKAASSESSSLTDDALHQVTVQQSEVETVAVAMTEMAASSNECGGNGREATELVNQVNKDAAKGRDMMNKAMRSIVRLAENVKNASQVIEDLESYSESIGAVLDVIRGIAEQTNLLALNAAIEAARAGEQERGLRSLPTKCARSRVAPRRRRKKYNKLLNDYSAERLRL
jgi:methyl-accepting chemotaxis protein